MCLDQWLFSVNHEPRDVLKALERKIQKFVILLIIHHRLPQNWDDFKDLIMEDLDKIMIFPREKYHEEMERTCAKSY